MELLSIDSCELEKAIIGCLLLDNKFLEIAKKDINHQDFRDNKCMIIFDAMRQLEERGVSIDPIMVINNIRREMEENIFPASWVYELVNEAPDIKLFEEYINELIDTRALEEERRIAQTGEIIKHELSLINAEKKIIELND